MAGSARSAAALVTVAGLAVGSACADNFTFSNDCGTGLWGTICPIGGGVYQSNWGKTGAPGPALLPGASDSVIVSGMVTMDVSPTVGSAVVTAGSTLIWPSTALTGSISSGGTVIANSGFNKFLVGSANNSSGGVWTISEGAFYLAPGTLSNAGGGTLNFSLNGSLRRSGGGVADSLLSNAGQLRVTGGNTVVSGITLFGGNTGVWETAAGSSLTIESVLLSGVINGDHDGTVTMTGASGLADNTTLTTAPGSNPWGWSSASIDTGNFTLTNSGWLRLDSGFNKFLTGTAVNGPSATWAVEQGSLYFSPGVTPTTITNNGTVLVNAFVRRNGGEIQNAVLNNYGTVRSSLAGAISGLTLVSGGVWATDAGASLDLAGVGLSGTFSGNHAGVATLNDVLQLAGNTTFGNAAGSANPWVWVSAAMSTGAFTFTNTGRLETSSGFNKFLTGTVVNSASGVWSFTQGNFYLSPASPSITTLTNNGTASITGGSGITRNGGARSEARLVNNGSWNAAGTGGSIQNLALTSNSGTWRAASGSTLTISDCDLSGTFIGDFTGDAVLGGSMLMNGNTTLTTIPASVKPWQWAYAAIDANGFTLTNSGRLETNSGFNKFLTGNAVNAAGASLTCTQGNLYLSPGGSSGVAVLTNNGTLTLNNGTSLPRNGGAPSAAVLNNNALMLVNGAGSSVEGLTVTNGDAGVVRIAEGASLTLPANWSMGGGRLEGAGVFYSGGLGMVNSGGTVAPGLGSTTGTLTSGYRYNQAAGGTLEIALVSNGVTQTVDKLVLSNGGFGGQASLGGTLRVTLPMGTDPAPIGGVDMLIVDAPGGLTGQFASVVVADPIPEFRYMVVYTPTQAFLRVIRRCGGADIGSAGADSNFDGQLDNNDFIVYIDRFFAQDPSADVGIAGGLYGSDGVFDNNDFISFIDLFFSGCH